MKTRETVECDDCHGKGHEGHPDNDCQTCGGVGEVCDRCAVNSRKGCNCMQCERCGSFDCEYVETYFLCDECVPVVCGTAVAS